jgi:exodeoxyribonuclease V alpha subunit
MLNKRSKTLLSESNVDSAIYYLQKADKIVNDSGRIYPKSIYENERTAARRIAELVTAKGPVVPKSKIAHEIIKYQTKNRIILNTKQQEAIYQLFESNILVLTGGPGTGKTAVIKAASYIYQQLFPAHSKALCAPTGRASQHLAKTSGMNAKTVHRLLNWGVKTRDEGENAPAPLKAKKDELNPLSEELIIPDEWSMADIELASSLLRAIPQKSKVLFVGDPDQLPSVGPGAVLRDMIKSQVVPVIHLDEIYRQAKNSLITENAHRINRGEMIQTDPGRKDFIFLERPDAESVQVTILTCVKKLLGMGYKIEDILVLSPMKKGTAGVIALDEAVKTLVNPANRQKKELTIGNRSFREGDIIIQNQRNSVDKDLYNGNMGIVKAIGLDPNDEENKEEGLLCDIWGKEVFLSREDILEFDFTAGYSITTHKSQGGQAKVVIAPVITNHYIMLTRNILYTAMTRAEEMLVLVGQKKAVAMAIANTTPNLRRTFLSERIRKLVEDKKNGAANMELFG